jgi:hypothetical protein
MKQAVSLMPSSTIQNEDTPLCDAINSDDDFRDDRAACWHKFLHVFEMAPFINITTILVAHIIVLFSRHAPVQFFGASSFALSWPH